MSREEIFNKIADMLSEQFDVDRSKIKGSLNFQDDLDADSIDFVEFVLKLEDEFGAKISDETAEKLTTVDKAVKYISEHSNKN
ncbi:acyl carrier protein [Philodulcilactobacillus myokoensis]|uniref:Acyl carrier protein n=1 Tax=Philodulcilactobacillus myokoensis TaxID=2929573 RepID=A0A9W6ES91_9LACO|nr:acyl carrier protein [Philodulcilactobacillus myokoensis]GLB46821.1 acyl carrier protein [Philodulcilactobacillus myokoensis]